MAAVYRTEPVNVYTWFPSLPRQNCNIYERWAEAHTLPKFHCKQKGGENRLYWPFLYENKNDYRSFKRPGYDISPWLTTLKLYVF